MTAAEALYAAIATQIAAHTTAVWNPTGIYTASQTGITIKAMPQSPDSIVALTIHDRDDHRDPGLPDQAIRFQVRLRTPKGNPVTVDTLAEAVTAALKGDHMNWGGITITTCHRYSYIPMGFDANNRPELALNFELLLPH